MQPTPASCSCVPCSLMLATSFKQLKATFPRTLGRASNSELEGEELQSRRAVPAKPWEGSLDISLVDGQRVATASQVLSLTVIKQLAAHLPNRFIFSDWMLLYSTLEHGCSLNTFYRCCAGKGACILAVKADGGKVFGGFATGWQKPRAGTNNSFYGSGECFLWEVEHIGAQPPMPDGSCPPPPEICHPYHWTSENNFFLYSDKEYCAMGSGGHFGLWLDEELLHGGSDISETYQNPCLCRRRLTEELEEPNQVEDDDTKFVCTVLEVWGFV